MIKWLKNIFKKKIIDEEITTPKPKKIKMDDVNFHVNVKSICYFETLVDKSFFEMDENDVIDMLYSIYMVNNPKKRMKKSTFIHIIERPDILKWMLREYTEISDIWAQFPVKERPSTSTDKSTGGNKLRMSDYASTLIVEYGMDPHYVFYEMDMWEISLFFEAIETKMKKDLVDKRFWAYLGMTPHIDTKKCKSPEALIPFEWEKEIKKKNREQDLKNNTFAVKNMLGGNIFGIKDEE